MITVFFKEGSGIYHFLSASKQQDFGKEVFPFQTFKALFNI